jgi:hypothetical protein
LEITFHEYDLQKIHPEMSGFFILAFTKLRIIQFIFKFKWTTF